MNTTLQDLELLTEVYHGIPDVDETYYKISTKYQYCGWTDFPQGLIDLHNGKHITLQGLDGCAIQLCNARINCNLPIIPDNIRSALDRMERKEMIVQCSFGDELGPTQVHHVFNNREVNGTSWAITGGCNLKCRHCFLSAPNAKFGELPTEVCLKMIDDFANCGLTRMSITGGEPLIREDLFILIDRMILRGITITDISTNGLLVTDDFLAKLEDRGLKPKFNMSYDGTNGWHDWLRGIPGSEKMLLKSFERLSKHGFPTGSAMTIHKKNAAEIVASIHQLYNVGCSSFKTNKVLDVGEWLSFGSECGLTYEELFEFYLDAIEELYNEFPQGMPMRIVLSRFYSVEKGEINYTIKPLVAPCTDYERVRACESTYRRFHISSDGRIQPCLVLSSIDEYHGKLPNVKDVGFANAMEDPSFLKIAAATVATVFEHNPECKTCEFASRCIGGCRAMGCANNPCDYYTKCPSNCAFFKKGYMDRLTTVITNVCPKANCINL